MADPVPLPHTLPKDPSDIPLEVDPSALGEGMPGADQLIRVGRRLLSQLLADELASAGSVKGRITRSPDQPADYELLAIILSATTYSAATRRIRFTFENAICRLISLE